MFKKILLLGLVSGTLAAIASVIYQQVYGASLGANFVDIAKPLNIFITSIAAGIVAAAGYWLLQRWLTNYNVIVFNFLFVLLSFASILGAFAFKLPFEVETPELFPGLVVPMHFFPALAWFTLQPIFIKGREHRLQAVDA